MNEDPILEDFGLGRKPPNSKRAMTKGLTNKKFNNQPGYALLGEGVEAGRIAVKFDDRNLGTKAIRKEHLVYENVPRPWRNPLWGPDIEIYSPKRFTDEILGAFDAGRDVDVVMLTGRAEEEKAHSFDDKKWTKATELIVQRTNQLKSVFRRLTSATVDEDRVFCAVHLLTFVILHCSVAGKLFARQRKRLIPKIMHLFSGTFSIAYPAKLVYAILSNSNQRDFELFVDLGVIRWLVDAFLHVVSDGQAAVYVVSMSIPPIAALTSIAVYGKCKKLKQASSERVLKDFRSIVYSKIAEEWLCSHRLDKYFDPVYCKLFSIIGISPPEQSFSENVKSIAHQVSSDMRFSSLTRRTASDSVRPGNSYRRQSGLSTAKEEGLFEAVRHSRKTLTKCSNSECSAINVKFKLCSGCNIVSYCSRKCQLNDWKSGHKQQCLRRDKKKTQL